MTDEIYIRTKTDAMKCIGKMVYWDDPGQGGFFLGMEYWKNIKIGRFALMAILFKD